MHDDKRLMLAIRRTVIEEHGLASVGLIQDLYNAIRASGVSFEASRVEMMRLTHLVIHYRDGDENGWTHEVDKLWNEQPAYMEKLVESINDFGMREPILLGDDGRVWDGHHRIAAAMFIGMAEVPVTRSGPTLTEQIADRSIVAMETQKSRGDAEK